MGTWGYKTFENDAASDWLYDLEEAKNANFLLEPLQAVNRARGKPDVDDCLESLAAAEVIAGARHEPPQGVPAIAKKWIRRTGFSPNDATVKLAMRAVGRVEKDSQLSDTWQEAEQLAAWRKAVEQLNRRLEIALKASPPKRAAKLVVSRQTLAEFIIEVAANPTPEKRKELCAKLTELADPNQPVGGRGLIALSPLHWVIACENPTKRFGHFTAVDHVSFFVAQGSIFGFLGPNGRAKSGCCQRPRRRDRLAAMQITVELPDQVARQWGDNPDAVGRHVLEDAAIECYREGRLSHRQFGQLLGLDYWQTEAFLQQRGVPLNYSHADLDADHATLDQILARP
jgi:predicted HTH domain antitoxin